MSYACTYEDRLLKEIHSCFFVSMLALSIAGIFYEANTPSAMDVYQKKTTLEYTVKDGIKLDSIVVYKGN